MNGVTGAKEGTTNILPVAFASCLEILISDAQRARSLQGYFGKVSGRF